MATLIPAIGSSSFDSTGERRLAERLEQKLDADYLLWHNVPIGPKQTHPDFVVLQARRGLLVLGIKHNDSILLRKSTSCEREGQAPVIIKLSTLRDDAFAIADRLASDHKEGYVWSDMAVRCARALAQRKLPQRVHRISSEYRPGADAPQVMTMEVTRGWRFRLWRCAARGICLRLVGRRGCFI